MTIETGRIYHEDCMDTMERMEDFEIDLVIADFPYQEVSKNDKGRDKYKGGIRDIKKGEADVLIGKYMKITREIQNISKRGFIFCGIEQLSEIYSYLDDLNVTRQCCWIKDNPSPLNGKKNYLSTIENIVFFKRHSVSVNIDCKRSIFNYPVGSSNRHPTEKPIKLITEMLGDMTKEEDLIYDPFMGSGTTAVACERLNRRWIGSEISEEYCEVARERIKRERDQLKAF
jgi:site-specific DNA-methyltransferase (adenine-specific)